MASSPLAGTGALQFQPGPLPAEVWDPPSAEVHAIVQRLPWLASPAHGEAGLVARLWLHFLVAPMTQLTFLNFELQAYLFLVFHRSRVAITGHGLFMTMENLFLLATLRALTVVHTPYGVVTGSRVYAAVLLLWYGVVSWRARLPGWFAVTVPVVGALYAASGPLAVYFRAHLHHSPVWGVMASALLVAASHSAEFMLPPRTADPWRWTSLRTYLTSPRFSVGQRLLHVAHALLLLTLGAVAESWASLRLMHYNWLMVMMRLGYAPRHYARLHGWMERAWATGQPALDYVGTGGGTFLAAAPATVPPAAQSPVPSRDPRYVGDGPS